MNHKRLEVMAKVSFLTGGAAYVLLMLLYGTYPAYLVLFTSVMVCLAIFSVPAFDFTWHIIDCKPATRRVWNLIGKSCTVIGLFCLIFIIGIPYYSDLKFYIKKDYRYETGVISRLDSSRTGKGHSWGGKVQINGKVLKFKRVTDGSKDFFEKMESSGEQVTITYLPNTKLILHVTRGTR